MNKHLLTQLVLALACALLFAVLPALAGPAATFHASFKGQLAQAYFDSTDQSGCVETFLYVLAVKGVGKETSQPDQGPQASVVISQTNICSGVLLIEGTGSAALTEVTFQIDKGLTSAKLDTTIEFCDSVSDTCYPVDAHVVWTSSGAPARVKDHVQMQAAGLKINSRSDGITCAAIASGSIADGSIKLRPETAFDVNLRLLKFGEVDLLH